MHLLTAPSLVADGRLCSPGWLLVDENVREYGEGQPPTRVTELADQTTAIPGGVLAPGLVDMQINGAFGIDFAAADDDDWRHVAVMLPSTGVTAYVPTLITAPPDDLAAGLRSYRSR